MGAGISRLAWRNLWRNRRRTLIMLAAVAVGVWAMVFMSAMMRGMVDEMVRSGLEQLPGMVQIHQRAYRDDPSVVNSMPSPEGTLQAALAEPPVTAWAARVRVPAMVASARASRGLTLLGVDPAAERALGSVPPTISEGRFLEDEHDRGVVLGQRLVERLESDLGKRVVIMSQDPQNDVADRGVRVVGIYKARLPGDEERFAYAGRAALQELLQVPGQVSEVAVMATDYRRPQALVEHLARAAGPQLEVLPWTELDPFLSSMLDLQDGFSLVFMVVVFLALSFGLVNTLAMAVFERIREIGLMQALGMRPGLILRQVLLESLYLLLLGLAVGNGAAWLTIKPLESGIELSSVARGMEMFAMGATLYPALYWRDMVLATVVVLGLGVLASLIPAWRAARLDPIRALNSH
ncbi:ABC transporter permease [Parahaliea maris]|uniref:ABC transporter permease n=1 Tax=Parahaliea maris TaxID=2716870 RepID=A0A5C9A2I3_9GAMM|nr:ABC transporter permease [Parahaliea maris]TXS94214.1 ABC transporter permease [Parahaliea maris]